MKNRVWSIRAGAALPDLEFLSQSGFVMELELETRVMEKSKIYHDLGLKGPNRRIKPIVDFPIILKQIISHENKISDSNIPGF